MPDSILIRLAIAALWILDAALAVMAGGVFARLFFPDFWPLLPTFTSTAILAAAIVIGVAVVPTLTFALIYLWARRR